MDNKINFEDWILFSPSGDVVEFHTVGCNTQILGKYASLFPQTVQRWEYRGRLLYAYTQWYTFVFKVCKRFKKEVVSKSICNFGIIHGVPASEIVSRIKDLSYIEFID